MYQNIRKAATLALYLLAVWFSIQYFLPLFLPFLLGALLALTAEPMVSFLSRKIPRPLAAGLGVTAALCFLALVLMLLLALLIRELGILAAMVPDLEASAETGLRTLSTWLLNLTARLPAGMQELLRRNIAEFFSGSSAMLDDAFRYVLSLTGGVLRHVPDSALVLGTAILSGYMISGKLPRIRRWLRRRISRERMQKWLSSARRVRDTVLGWLKAQCKLMGITWMILTLGFVLLRIPYAPLWAAVVSLVDAFPVLGTGTVLLPWALISFLQGRTPLAIGLLGCYGTVSLSRSILEPRLLGNQLGLDPLATLAALYAGYQLWGLGGLILAPLLTVLAMQLLQPSPRQDS